MGTDFPLVSVVIPNYNYGRYVRQAVDSVLAQTYPSVEIIVVDDGSSDDSVALLQSYGSSIKLVAQSNGGVHKARNRGIEESKGEFVAFLDADDWWEPTKLARQMELFADPRVGLVHCGVVYVSSDGKVLGSCTDGIRGSALRPLLLRAAPFAATTIVVKRECMTQVGMYNGGFFPSEDFEFCVRVAAKYAIEFCPEPLVRYRSHPLSGSHNIASFEKSSLAVMRHIFEKPQPEIAHCKRQAFAIAYRILSGTCYRTGRLLKALWYGLCAVAWWPPEVGYVFKSRQRFGPQLYDRHLTPER